MDPITTSFPYPTLTSISEKPTPSTLQIIERELTANAMEVPSTRGGGDHGHAALVTSPEDYLNMTGVAFVPPQHPGQAPVHAPNATNAQIHAADTTYNRDLQEYLVYRDTATKLKNQLIKAVPAEYIHILKDPKFAFANVTVMQLLTHLKTEYGKLTPAYLEKQREKLKAPWNPDDGIEKLFNKAQDVQALAATSTSPISNDAIMVLLLLSLQDSGVMTTYISEWNRKPEADKTWTNFREHFKQANKQRCSELTIAQAGFRASQMANVTETPAPAPAPTVPPAPTAQLNVIESVNWYYCWTHGLCRNPNHTSATCTRPAPGHKLEATFLKNLGGSDKIHRTRPSR